MERPDCPHCRAANTLEPVAGEGHGTILCECSCCSKRCRLNAGGEIVWPKVERDVSGRQTYGE